MAYIYKRYTLFTNSRPNLFGEVVAVDVVAVGMASWTLNIDAMTLQDCGFLEKENGLLDCR